MKAKINLTREECDYLTNVILKKHKKIFPQVTFSENVNNSMDIGLDENVIRNILKLIGNEIRLRFDKNYKPTEKDKILEHLIDKLYKVKIKVNLTREEYDYLINFLLKSHQEILSQLMFIEEDNNSICVELEAGVADDIRELAGDEVGLHFDENYEPTKEGWILEHFIDKFYFE